MVNIKEVIVDRELPGFSGGWLSEAGGSGHAPWPRLACTARIRVRAPRACLVAHRCISGKSVRDRKAQAVACVPPLAEFRFRNPLSTLGYHFESSFLSGTN